MIMHKHNQNKELEESNQLERGFLLVLGTRKANGR